MTRKGIISRKAARSAKKARNSETRSDAEFAEPAHGVDLIASIENVAGIILAVTEKRNWIEVFFEGDLMHTHTVDFPSGIMFNIYIEEIPHKTTVYEHPRTMIFFDGPCDLEITREGEKIIVTGNAPRRNFA